MQKNVRTYGGAVSPFDCIVVKAPISEMIVGANSGSDAKGMVAPK